MRSETTKQPKDEAYRPHALLSVFTEYFAWTTALENAIRRFKKA